MYITPQILDGIMGFNTIWVFIHLIYFGVYYSKYSSLFHKFIRLNTFEKHHLYEKEFLDLLRDKNWKKIQKLRAKSYYPVICLTFFHLITFYFYWKREIFELYYLSVIYIAIGSFIFVFLANVTQGSRVLRGGFGSRSSGGI
ncbi:hypothetical protein [Fluviicola taffensis]|uniref:Uncharacterized protein n=1 Tax=Fluviicola taffensis (strain DSM 16823 / NCIMB 13979 / RW262) TaxID=755732 RepID=F2IJM5_FLUTR|nr:hypothetical protein [Fluviicola taffensis]AEA43915.1 hypothetical protein Fluta_1928 [Fluviicola taffensis DSM 16823]